MVGLISGCAHPNLPEDYANAAKGSVVAIECKNKGFWSGSDFNRCYPEMMSSHLSSNYDRTTYFQQVEIMQKQFAIEMEKPGSETNLKNFCDSGLMQLAERLAHKQQGVADQRAIDELNAALGQQVSILPLQQLNPVPPPTLAPMNINPLKQGNVRNCWTANGIEYCK
jgi:hypothetical protein